jgi:hypothetical protein
VLLTLLAVQRATVSVTGVAVGSVCLATYADGSAVEPGAILTARCAAAGVVTVERTSVLTASLQCAAKTINVRVIP